MDLPLVDRDLTSEELARLRLGLSTFQDGSGWERDKSGVTLPGWRQMERVVAEALHGSAPENKGVFDVVLTSGDRAVGVSVKSKELSRKGALEDLAGDGRLYLEIANSPALFWSALEEQGLTEEMFKNGFDADAMGQAVLGTVHGWHKKFAADYSAAHPAVQFDLAASLHMVLSTNVKNNTRRYQVHAVALEFPTNISWEYRPAKSKAKGCRSIRGWDPSMPDEVLVDWYGLSGGQLKLYPRAKGLRSTPIFTLAPVPTKASILDRARAYWPDEYPPE